MQQLNNAPIRGLDVTRASLIAVCSGSDKPSRRYYAVPTDMLLDSSVLRDLANNRGETVSHCLELTFTEFADELRRAKKDNRSDGAESEVTFVAGAIAPTVSTVVFVAQGSDRFNGSAAHWTIPKKGFKGGEVSDLRRTLISPVMSERFAKSWLDFLFREVNKEL